MVLGQTRQQVTLKPGESTEVTLAFKDWLLEEGFPGPNNRMNSLHDSVNFYESHDEIGNHHAQRTNPASVKLFKTLRTSSEMADGSVS